MFRQRLTTRRARLAWIGKLVLTVLALALVWYGAMTVLLAVKVSPSLVETLSGYRTAFDFLADLTPADLDADVRLVTGLVGLAAFLLFGYLALRELPKPHLARTPISLTRDGGIDRGATEVAPRAIERAAEIAATQCATVEAAAGRLDDDAMKLRILITDPASAAASLRAVQREAAAALSDHGVALDTVDVTVTGFDKTTRRELA